MMIFFSHRLVVSSKKEARERRSNFETFVAVFFHLRAARAHQSHFNKVFVLSLFIGFSKNLMMILMMMMKMIGVNRPKQRGARGSRRKKKKEKIPSFFLLFSFFSSFLETTFRLIKASSSTDTEFRGKEEEFFFRKVSLFLFLFFSLVALVNHNTHSPH